MDSSRREPLKDCWKRRPQLRDFSCHCRRFLYLDMFVPVQFCLSLSAAVQISTEGPDVHIFFVRYLRPSYDLVEGAADGAFLNFLIFGLLGYQALLCASLALGDQLNVMQAVSSTVGAGGCLAVGSNMIRGGEMAEDFYYIREQRRGNVQVGAALVLMGALYVAEGALRLYLLGEKLYYGEMTLFWRRPKRPMMIMLAGQIAASTIVFVLYLLLVLRLHRPLSLPPWQSLSGRLVQPYKDRILEKKVKLLLAVLRQAATDAAVCLPPPVLCLAYAGMMVGDRCTALLIIGSSACALCCASLTGFWLYSLSVDPLVGAAFQPLEGDGVVGFASVCALCAAAHLMALLFHCCAAPAWNVPPRTKERRRKLHSGLLDKKTKKRAPTVDANDSRSATNVSNDIFD